MSEKAQKDEIVPVLKEMKRSIAMLTSNQNTLVKQVQNRYIEFLKKYCFLDYQCHVLFIITLKYIFYFTMLFLRWERSMNDWRTN